MPDQLLMSLSLPLRDVRSLAGKALGTSNVVSAQALLRRCLEIEPERVNARVALGTALMRPDPTREAREVLEQAVAEDPDNPWTHRNPAGAQQHMGETEDALEYRRSTVSLSLDDAQAWGWDEHRRR